MVEGFRDEVVGAGFDRLRLLLADARRDHDHRQHRGVVVRTQRATDGVAVEAGHHHVEEDQVGFLRLDEIERRPAVGCGHDLVARAGRAPPPASGRSRVRRRRRGSWAAAHSRPQCSRRPGSARRRRRAWRDSRRTRRRGNARCRRSSPARSARARGSRRFARPAGAAREPRRRRSRAAARPSARAPARASEGELDRILARCRLERAVSLGLQHVADELHVLLVVLDDEDPLTGHCFGLPP